MDAVGAILEGASLPKMAADELESLLLTQPDNANVRFQLIGYYYVHYYCCVRNRPKRLAHMLWVIESSLFSYNLWSFFDVDLVDVEMFTTVEDALKLRINFEPENLDLVSAAASFIRPHAPHEALEMFEFCVEKDPLEKRYQKDLSNIRQDMDLYLKKKRTSLSAKFERTFRGSSCDGHIVMES